jgi:predicted phosphodiesterase
MARAGPFAPGRAGWSNRGEISRKALSYERPSLDGVLAMNECLDRLLESSKIIDFKESSKIVLFSDCHRGDNSWADDFALNKNLFHYALYYYNKNGYTYIEVGDGDELWENPFHNVWDAHLPIFELMQKYFDTDPLKNRLHLIYGNHDRKKEDPAFIKNSLQKLCQNSPESTDSCRHLFENVHFHEGLILRHTNTGKRILVIHGHQGDPLCDQFAFLSEFLVRILWKPLQQITGFKDPTSPANNHSKRMKISENIKTWLGKNPGTAIIMGHTHEPYLAMAGEAPYYNTGSCVHPRHITGIEIVNDQISLVRWGISADPESRLFVKREPIGDPVHIS